MATQCDKASRQDHGYLRESEAQAASGLICAGSKMKADFLEK